MINVIKLIIFIGNIRYLFLLENVFCDCNNVLDLSYKKEDVV